MTVNVTEKAATLFLGAPLMDAIIIENGQPTYGSDGRTRAKKLVDFYLESDKFATDFGLKKGSTKKYSEIYFGFVASFGCLVFLLYALSLVILLNSHGTNWYWFVGTWVLNVLFMPFAVNLRKKVGVENMKADARPILVDRVEKAHLAALGEWFKEQGKTLSESELKIVREELTFTPKQREAKQLEEDRKNALTALSGFHTEV